MAMTPTQRRALIAARFGHWTEALETAAATPIVLIAVGDPEATGAPPLQVFVPHREVRECELMVTLFRRLADALEAQGPEEASHG